MHSVYHYLPAGDFLLFCLIRLFMFILVTAASFQKYIWTVLLYYIHLLLTDIQILTVRDVLGADGLVKLTIS